MPRVLIADKLEAAGLELLRDAGIEVETRLGLKGDELAAALREFDACIVRSQPKVTAECWRTPASCARSSGPASASTTSTCRPRRARASWS